MEVTATFEDHTLAKIIHLVEEAQEQKGRNQAWIERFGRRSSPAVVLLIAVAAGIGAADRRGILIQGGVLLEHLGVMRTFAFDKTCTLTLGKPQLTELFAIDDDEATCYIGSPALYRDLGSELGTLGGRIRTLKEEGKTVVLVGDV